LSKLEINTRVQEFIDLSQVEISLA